jgi:hypothetical protein
MARAAKRITNGLRIAEALSVGVLGRTYPRSRIRSILAASGRQSERQRDLPMDVMVYYVIALGLYLPAAYQEVLRCLVEGLGWLEGTEPVRVAGKSGIAKARQRLGAAPLVSLFGLCGPRAAPGKLGAFYGSYRLVSVDGSTLDVADTRENRDGLGRHRSSRGEAAFPCLRFAALVETGTHLIFAAEMSRVATNEVALAEQLLPRVDASMLILADRLYASFVFLAAVADTGAKFLARIRKEVTLPVLERFPDGSYRSRMVDGRTRRRDRLLRKDILAVRVIIYQVAPGQETYRLVTNLLDPVSDPALKLAALYPQRWEHEGVYDEFKTHLRGAQVVLRSKTPELVRQEFFGLCLAHYAVRSLMLEAADQDTLDPDQLSFTHAVRVVRRKLASPPVFPPSAAPRPPSPTD